MYKRQFLQLFRLLIVLSSILLGCFLIMYSAPYLYPLILAIIFAYFIIPSVNFLQDKLHFPRGLATLTIISSVFMTFIGIVVVVIMEIYQGTVFLAERIPSYFQDLVLYFESIFNTKIIPIQEKFFSLFLTLDPSQQASIKERLNEMINHIGTTGSAILQDSLSNIPNILSILPNSITIFIFIVLGTFLIANDWYKLSGKIKNLIPDHVNISTRKIFSHLKKALGGYVKAQIILISLSGFLTLIGLLILQVEQALTIAALSALVDLIPFLGTGIIFIPWIIYLFMNGNYPLTIGLTILYMVVVVTRQLLEPKVLSSNMGFHPLLALIGYFIGLQIWGLFGLLIAPAIIILLNALYQTGAIRSVWMFIKG